MNKECELILVSQTKRLGFAVFHRRELIHYGVKTFRSPRSEDTVTFETAVTMSGLIGQFSPVKIIVRSLEDRQANSHVQKRVVIQIMHSAHSQAIPVQSDDFAAAKQKLVARKAKPTNVRAFAKLASMFPELQPFVNFHNPSNKEYYAPMLSAIAIGVCRRHTKRKSASQDH